MEDKHTTYLTEHTANVKKELSALMDHLHKEIESLQDPSAKALFEVSAEK